MELSSVVKEEQPRWYGFVHVSGRTTSGKGWARTPERALEKLVALQCASGWQRRTDDRAMRHVARARARVLQQAGHTGFAACERVFVSGDDRLGTAAAVRALLPRASVILV